MTRFVDYDELCEISAKIRKQAEEKLKNNPKEYALSKRDELLMAWLTVLPWRPKHLRQIRIGSRMDGANLFKGRIAAGAPLARPGWVEEALVRNPRQHFWQFRFPRNGTKVGHEIHAVLPRQLVPLLEEYLTNCRPLLVTGHDPGNLFLNRNGRPFDANSLTKLVGDLSRRHIRKRVTPYLFRHSFATKWVEEDPTDVLILSKVLWHRNLRTTFTTIGPHPDESEAVRRTEEWLEKRGLTKKKKQPSRHRQPFRMVKEAKKR
jgi:hypothetical protein